MRGAEQLRYKFVCAIRRATDIGTLIPGILHADSAVTPGTYYVHHNHRGDVIITRSGTTTIGTCEYSAFGNLKSSIGNDLCQFKFSSKERDPSTGFYYYGYRFYAPTWQRWISRDPIGENGGFNLYGFVLSNSISYVDTDGRFVKHVSRTFPVVLPRAVRAVVIECPECDVALAGFALGYVVGHYTGFHDWLADQLVPDVDTSPLPIPRVYMDYKLEPVNPGRDEKWNCRPCPKPPPPWKECGKPGTHGSPTGEHWHWFEYHQDPKTCICYPKRRSGPKPPE